MFSPQLNKKFHPNHVTGSVVQSGNVKSAFLDVPRYVILILLAFVSGFFMPGVSPSLGFDKTLFAMFAVTVVVVSVSLLALRLQSVKTIMPVSLGIFWLFVIVSYVSAFLSGDLQDAVRGSVMESTTAGFVTVLALIMTVTLTLQNAKKLTLIALGLFGLTGILLTGYCLLRLLLGADFMSFGIFNSVTVYPGGGLNDLAILAAVLMIGSMITLAHFPLKIWMQLLMVVSSLVSLAVLAIANFFIVWLVIAVFSSLILLYIAAKNNFTFAAQEKESARSTSSLFLILTLLVCVAGWVFVLASDYIGEKIVEATDVSYVEVRPSLKATSGLLQEVYQDAPLFGVGPNRFVDAWQLYKDPAINQSLYWNTDFTVGFGLVPTFFITHGVLGGLLVILFHIWFLFLGYKMFVRATKPDPVWSYAGLVSFAIAVFLWGMSYVYVPNVSLLILAALFTGLTYVAARSLLPESGRTIPLAHSRQRAFMLMALVILVIAVFVGSVTTLSRQYFAESKFTAALAESESAEELQIRILEAQQLYADDRFARTRAQLHLNNMNQLLAIESPTEEQRQQFATESEQALLFSQEAINLDRTNPDNQIIQASVYNILSIAGVQGAQELAEQAWARAQKFDPLNPGYNLALARAKARIGDSTAAREEIVRALSLKSNYTDALYFSAQLDIQEGNTEKAIETTRAMIQLEPRNPTRYFQLGVLLSANGDSDSAMMAYRSALSLDPQYANARYLLALVMIQRNQIDEALENLRLVAQNNPDNNELNALIRQLESGEPFPLPEAGLNPPVAENQPELGLDDIVTTDSAVDTDLVSQVNPTTEQPRETVDATVTAEELEVTGVENATGTETSQ